MFVRQQIISHLSYFASSSYIMDKNIVFLVIVLFSYIWIMKSYPCGKWISNNSWLSPLSLLHWFPRTTGKKLSFFIPKPDLCRCDDFEKNQSLYLIINPTHVQFLFEIFWPMADSQSLHTKKYTTHNSQKHKTWPP